MEPSWEVISGASPAPWSCTLHGVSAKQPQTYILHTVVLFIVLATAMVLFLKHQWG